MSKKKSARKKDKKDKPPSLYVFFGSPKPDNNDQENGSHSLIDGGRGTDKPSITAQKSKKTVRKKSKAGPASEPLLDVIKRSLATGESTEPDDQPVVESVTEHETGQQSLFFEKDNEPVIYIASYNFLQEHYDQVFSSDSKETWLLATADTIPGHIDGELLARIDSGYGEIEAPGELLDGTGNNINWIEFEREYHDSLGRQYMRKPHVFREIVNISLSGEGRVILACHLSPRRQCTCQVLADFLYEMSSYELGVRLVIKKLG